MASDNQITANRENARLSTGPKTPDGKAHSARNATRHGLLSREAVLPEEDPEEFRELLASLEDEFQPATPSEQLLVESMASAQWRLRRLTRIETGFLIAETRHVRKWTFSENEQKLPTPSTPQGRFARDTLAFGHVLNQNSGGDAFGKLIRYQTVLQRAFYKALETLRKSRLTPLPPAAPAVTEEPQPSVPNEPNSPPPDDAACPAAVPNEPEHSPLNEPNSPPPDDASSPTAIRNEPEYSAPNEPNSPLPAPAAPNGNAESPRQQAPPRNSVG
jgi:hypothetical protein